MDPGLDTNQPLSEEDISDLGFEPRLNYASLRSSAVEKKSKQSPEWKLEDRLESVAGRL